MRSIAMQLIDSIDIYSATVNMYLYQSVRAEESVLVCLIRLRIISKF